MSDDAFTQEMPAVSARVGHEQWLAPYREEFERVIELDAVIRGVNTALVTATTREGMTEAICERLADSALYRLVCMADRPTWSGNADRWTIAGDATDEASTPPAFEDDDFDELAQADGWLVVPIMYDRTVYGALGLLSSCRSVDDRERSALRELGGVIGHAINAVELRRLLADESVIELELRTTDAADPLVEAVGRTGFRFELAGLVPATATGSVAYLRVENATAEAASERLAIASGDTVRTVREHTDGDGGVVAWTVDGDSLLGQLAGHGGHVTAVTAAGDAAKYTAELPSDADVRALLDCVQHVFPKTWLSARRELDRPLAAAGGLSAGGIERLTDRQHEVLEVAYRAGYFRWPRDSTAEEVAEMLDISRPTFHAHLRKAEANLLGELFETDTCRPVRHR